MQDMMTFSMEISKTTQQTHARQNIPEDDVIQIDSANKACGGRIGMQRPLTTGRTYPGKCVNKGNTTAQCISKGNTTAQCVGKGNTSAL